MKPAEISCTSKKTWAIARAFMRRSAILVSWEMLQNETQVEAEFTTKLKHLLE